jgi:hypothetical protein
MRRREFITLLGRTAVAWPLAARGQQPDRVRRIGVLMGYSESDSEAQSLLAAFVQELQKMGWADHRNLRIDIRWATPTDAAAMQRSAKELVALQPDLILSSTTPTTTALLQQTRTIAVIFATVGDPIGSGFVASLSRPGGNVTGFTYGSLCGRQVSGDTQADRAAGHAGLCHVQPGSCPFARAAGVENRGRLDRDRARLVFRGLSPAGCSFPACVAPAGPLARYWRGGLPRITAVSVRLDAGG